MFPSHRFIRTAAFSLWSKKIFGCLPELQPIVLRNLNAFAGCKGQNSVLTGETTFGCNNNNNNSKLQYLLINFTRYKSKYTKAEINLLKNLEKEVVEEVKVLKMPQIPTHFEEYHIACYETVMKLIKKHKNYYILITFTVNKSLKEDGDGWHTRPNFTIYFLQNHIKLGFNCSYEEKKEGDNAYTVFGIDSVSNLGEDLKPNIQISNCRLLDELSKEILMKFFIEKISMDFLERLCDFIREYECMLYLQHCQQMQVFNIYDVPNPFNIKKR